MNKVKSAEFIKGVVGPDDELEKDIPQIAFVGRSNVGKSSLINLLTNRKDLARISARPGRTQEINLFLVNDECYFLDLPGYGYAKTSKKKRVILQDIIYGYLFDSPYDQKKVVMVIDAKVGPKEIDLEVLKLLEEYEKDIVVVVNKIDKVKKSEYKKQIDKINETFGLHKMIPFSVKDQVGREELLKEILS